MDEPNAGKANPSIVERITHSLTTATGLVTAVTLFIGAVIGLIALFGGRENTSRPPSPTSGPVITVPVVEEFTIDDWADAADATCEAALIDLNAAVQLAQQDPVAGFDAASTAIFAAAGSLREIREPSTRTTETERYIARWRRPAARCVTLRLPLARVVALESTLPPSATHKQSTAGRTSPEA